VVVLDRGSGSGTLRKGTYQLIGGTANTNWERVLLLTPSDFNTFVSDNPDVSDNTSDRHSHSNKTLLDSITSIGSGAVITTPERDDLHTHSNKTELDNITDAGSGEVVTSAERADFHDHTNKSILDSISDAGSGSVITPQERTELSQADEDRHTHVNKDELDDITSSGSGDIITSDERDRLNGGLITTLGDFTVSVDDERAILLVLEDTLNPADITITLPNDPTGFPNGWKVTFISITSQNITFTVESGATINTASGNKGLNTQNGAVTFVHTPGPNSTWYGFGDLEAAA